MSNQNRYHVIKDPVHGTMQFTDMEDSWLKPFINSAHFQRLRHIKQLGMGDYIFPGAVHTRFNHCLGCSYVGSQIAHKIGLADEERQLVMIACLLHDIGHGPFSHTFEDIFFQKMIRHEDWTPFFLADYRNSGFFDDYNQQNPRYTLTQAKFSQVEDMIMHRPTAKPVLADIVSSQLDADRLDYLLRDSHFCGVAYGQFDFRWMLNCMAIVNSEQHERLGITYKGIGVVEHYLMARRLMLRNIYYSPKKLAFEYLLIQLLTAIAEQLETPAYHSLKETPLGTFLFRANEFNQAVRAGKDVKALKQNFLSTCYPIYKELCDHDVFILIRQLAELADGSPASQIALRLQNRIMPKTIPIDLTQLSQVEAAISEFKQKQGSNIQAWQLALIKTPHTAYVADGDPVLVVNPRGAVRPINELSLMLSAMSDKHEQTAFICLDRSLTQDERVMALIEKLGVQEGVQA